MKMDIQILFQVPAFPTLSVHLSERHTVARPSGKSMWHISGTAIPVSIAVTPLYILLVVYKTPYSSHPCQPLLIL